MPRNLTSEERKKCVVSVLKSQLGALNHYHSHRSDWYSSENGKVEVFVTDSEAHFDRRPWFDMNEKDIRKLANHPAAFVVFILGEYSNYLVIPAKCLAEQLPNHNEGRTAGGFYHFNIVLGQQGFKQLSNWPLRQYRNKIEFIASALNSLCDENPVASGLLLN